MGQLFAGRYELVDLLGEGGGGSVWRAWDHRARRYLAAKVLRQRDAGALLRFVREQSLRVAHPHVVAPTGWAAEDDDVLLTMDLVGGGSLATLLGDYGGLPVPIVIPLLDQLLDALAAVHTAGLVHRDVKPANLLLEPTGTAPPFVRLADFGIAVALDDPRLTGLGLVMGTAGYVAPEVMLGADPDPRQDLWSVGVVGRQLLTAERADPAGVRVVPVPGMDPVLGDWLAWLSGVDLAGRPVDAAAARRGLAEVPRGRSGESVEVFDHLAHLPRGWEPGGPTSERRSGGPEALRSAAVTGEAGRAQAGRAQPGAGRPVAATAAESSARTQPTEVGAGAVSGQRRVNPLGPVRLGLIAALLVAAVALFVLAATGDTSLPAGPSDPPSEPAGSLVGQTCSLQGTRTQQGDARLACRAGSGGLTWARE